MLLLTVKLLEQCKEVRHVYYDRFQHILVDEFQDTNMAQYKLINMLYTNLHSEIPKNRHSVWSGMSINLYIAGVEQIIRLFEFPKGL